MAVSPPNFYKMDSSSACIQVVLKFKVKVKGHVIPALSWILGMSYSVIDGLVFSALQHAERAICYRPSVRLSVTRVDQSKTIEARIMQFSPYSSPIPLVFEG